MAKKSFTQDERDRGTAFVEQYVKLGATVPLTDWFFMKVGDKRKAKRLMDACKANELYLRLHNGLPKHRDYFTDEEHIALGPLGDQFCMDLARAAAKVLAKFPPEVSEAVTYYLQDRTSLFSPFTSDLIDEYVKEERK